MLSIVLHGIVWYCMELLCILWHRIFSCHSIVSYGIAWYCIISYGIALLHCCIHGIAWYCIASYGIAWYCIVCFGARAVSRKTPIYFILNNLCMSMFVCALLLQAYTGQYQLQAEKVNGHPHYSK